MADRLPTPCFLLRLLQGRCCIQHSRFTKQDGWQLDDISVNLYGDIAVSCGNENTHQTSIDVYSVRNSGSRDKPKIFYSKHFENYESNEWDYWVRLVSFVDSYGDNRDPVIVTGLGDKLELFDLIQDRVLKSRKITLINHGGIRCLSVRDKELLIGFKKLYKITVYDVIDLNETKSIILQGIQDGYWPYDMTAIANRIFVCVGTGDGEEECNERSLIFEKKHGSFLSELTKPTDTHWYTTSITVSVTLGVVAVVWYDSYDYVEGIRYKIVFYSLFGENKSSFLIVEIESGVLSIRISDRGDRMVTGNWKTGEVNVYDMAACFTYNHLKTNLISQLQTNDCLKLGKFFAFPEEQIDAIVKSVTPAENLLLALEEKGVIRPSNVDRLTEPFTELEISSSCYYLIDFYQKSRMQATFYGRFLATLSAHLTASLPGDLCDYFHIPDEEKRSITSSQNPGLSLLLALDEKSIIKPSEVEALDQPFTELRLVQAVAKVHEYQSEVEEEKNQLQKQTELTEDGKKALFIQCLQKKIQSWYETMTPVPWKKSCRWKSTDLFVGSGLVLTDSQAKRSLANIDEKCKLQYTQILNHDRLKTEKRIILEGEPGTGKTMMSSQVAYDWSQGKISEADVLFFLPLKFVNNVTLLEAIKRFYFSAHDNISIIDIEGYLTNEDLQSCLILDGLEEYNSGGMTSPAEPSEVVKVMEKSKYPNCKVILTSRSDYAKDLPSCPMLRIGRFGENERNTYIEKVFADNTEKQQEIKRVIENTPFILDLCSVPLLFVLAVHNVDSMGRLEESQFDRVAPFMENMVRTLCSSSESTREDSSLDGKEVSDGALLEEYAYNGLCKGRQILSWQKDTLEKNIYNLKQYLDSGILVVEEGIIKGTLKNVQEETREDESSQKKKKPKKNKKETTEIDQMNKTTLGITGATASTSHQEHSVSEGSKENVAVADAMPVFYKTKKNISRRKTLMRRLTPKIFTKKKDFHTKETKHNTVANVRAEDLSTHELVQDDRDPTTRESVVTPPSESASTQSESESEAESGLSQSPKTSNGSTAKDFPLQVKFLHKVMQEWFASKYLSMLWKSWGDNSHREFLHDVLPQISPIDLHYLLRFTSYLCPPSCHLIMDFLLESHRTADGDIPEYITNCVCLCFAEYNGIMGLCMKDVVFKMCAEIIPIQSDDSRLIQQSKMALLRFAASVGILIKGVQLIDVVSEVDEKSFTFNSGVKFDVFNMIQVIEVSRWDQHLEEKDYGNILKFVLCSHSIRKARLHFPSQPPVVDEEALEDVVIYDKTVEWIIGPRFIQTLNMETGMWKMAFNTDDISFIRSRQMEAARDFPTLLKTAEKITKSGGMLDIPNTGVTLVIPPNALPEGMEQCVMQIRIIPREMVKDQEASFSSNSTTVVELLPNRLSLQRPVRLSLPHCLVLQDTVERNAHIIVSHHINGSPPHWEEHTHLPHYLEDTSCIILLDNFCWVAYSINDKIVKAKKIVVYAAAKKLLPQDDTAEIQIGYYPDLPGANEYLVNNRSLMIAHMKTFFFRKRKKRFPLRLSIDGIFPSEWRCSFPHTHIQEISYEAISSSIEYSLVYILEKTNVVAGNPLCIFTVSQEKGQIPVQLAVHPQIIHKDHRDNMLPSRRVMNRSMYELTQTAKAKITNIGGTLEIPGTGVALEILPDSLPTDMDHCVIHMRIIPSRIVEDKIKSFCSNSCTAVEILPHNLNLRQPAQLRLPHCLKLDQTKERTARIYVNHYEQGSPSHWEHKELSYKLEDKACIIQLDEFCCVKYSIDDTIVTAKKIIVYTAAKQSEQKDELAEVEVGYYSDIPGGGELLRLNPNLAVDCRKKVYFMEEQRFPLQLTLEAICPSGWTCCFPQEMPQEIPFKVIASSIEHSHLYILQTMGGRFRNPRCVFIASQEEGHGPIQLSLQVYQQVEEYVRESVQSISQEESNATASSLQVIRSSSAEPESTISEEPSRYESDETEHRASRNEVIGYQTVEPNSGASQSEMNQQLVEFQQRKLLPYMEQQPPAVHNVSVQQYHYTQHLHMASNPSSVPLEGPYSPRESHLHGDSEERRDHGLKYSLLLSIAKKLDPTDLLGNDWRLLAEELGFTVEDITVFERDRSPTISVIQSAVRRSKFESLEQLKLILIKINRSDAAKCISNWHTTS